MGAASSPKKDCRPDRSAKERTRLRAKRREILVLPIGPGRLLKGGRGYERKPPAMSSRLFTQEMATWHSRVIATRHAGITGVLATRHSRRCKRSPKREPQENRKAQHTCCDVFHR